ncbi:ATP-dependent DNA helicase [Paenibacillus albiflavus]|uniref:ATP-dependent DNA helicase n=1 Tax=Paenibacillus albiflavus TaxID=2545760 RepID=A0A4R4EL13_9BACL|nr:ATP-dependent DNA helicase [Paenibacillus albiflavus]TCZ80914.1 ATP-dependent DNA helicase [Paenibacillus albiflavus]
MKQYPFAYKPSESFVQQVSDFVADVFYEVLPEVGFEIRDEQIYMAFQLERAFAEKKTIFAEAGVGTGKTLVYLLYTICYARHIGKPAIIACADESLIEQLVKPEGDIAKLAKHLNMNIDVRLGKSPDQYVCLNKLDIARTKSEEAELYQDIYDDLPEFVHVSGALQSFYHYGDRKDYKELNDDQWNQMNWDVFQDCLVCDARHRCGQTLSRDHYRKAADIIICSHDFYMEHVWTYEGRKREGQLPLLPDHSSVVFDEGHLLEAAAQKALTYKLKHNVFEEIITRLLQGEVREELAWTIEEAISLGEHMFELLGRNSVAVRGSDRKEIIYTDELVNVINKFKSTIGQIEEELVFESGIFTLDEYQLRIVEEHLEMIGLALSLYNGKDQLISWLIEDANGLTLVIMPKMVKEVLEEHVFSQKMPVVFSSATLSLDGSFEYVADNLGIKSYLSMSVPSPYDYEEQMKLIAPKLDTNSTETQLFVQKASTAIQLLKESDGKALVLFNSKEELKQFKQILLKDESCSKYHLLFEGDQEISHLIAAFQEDENSILCAVTLWEGLDIPGPSLSNVIIWSLPFPPNDPVFAAKRKAADDSFKEVDMPYMLLRLRQGIGRLIRSREDRGSVSILGQELHDNEFVREKIKEIIPKGVSF